MDRSMNLSASGKSPFSPRPRQNITKRPIGSSFRKSSRFSVSGKSSQSVQIILSSAYNYVERFGQQLPVLITEALQFAGNVVVSARISKYGYAWVVCGRRLLIWQYRQSPTDTTRKSTLLNQCFELQLPQSDLAHRAELISVFINPSTRMPSCIAISPEGVVRYWPAIVHEGVSVEEQVNLQGQECDSLTDVEGLGCILATTTCTVLLIQPHLNGGRHVLRMKPLKMPTGWLGGFSRRMSSLIFGPISSENASETRLVRVLSVQNNLDSWTVFILADHSIQKWHLSQQTELELVYVSELQRIVRDSFRSTLWENCVGGDQSEIDTWLLDFQLDKDTLIILTAAVNVPVSPRVHYALMCIQAGASPTVVKDFLLLKITDLYREESTEFLSYRFLMCGTYAYLYNQRCVTVIKPQEDPDTLVFDTPQDYLLAGSICVNTPLFFTKKHGLVAIASNDMGHDLNLSVSMTGGHNSPVDVSFNDNVVVNNLSIYNIDPENMFASYSDTVSKLKSAFIYHIKNEESMYRKILDEIFPADTAKLLGVDSLLDKVLVITCKDLLDDIPAGDPRWTKDSSVGIGSSYSMQVVHQLEDKQKAYILLMKFLRTSGLWQRLAAITVRNMTLATTYALGEYYEKLVAAIVLKSFANSRSLEKAIEKIVANSAMEFSNGLTNQDVFFREVSQIHRGIQELVNYCEDVCHSNMEPGHIVEVILEVNEIVLAVLREVVKFRKMNYENYKPSESVLNMAPDFLLWTAASGPDGLLDTLSQLHHLTYNYGIVLSNNERVRNDLLEHLLALSDSIFDGKRAHLDSIKNTSAEEMQSKQYASIKQKFIKPFLQEKDWQRAAKLAEKYHDFETLIYICDSTDNQDRLDEYLERFNDSNFSEYVYNWFLKENKQGKLIDKCRRTGKSKNLQQISNFLTDHPSLSWLQNIFDKKYNQAADTLQRLGMEETESVTRQKTMFSLCKLSKLAAGEGSDADIFVKSVDSRLDLISFQEDIPDYILQQFGYDTVNIKVIPPQDLIHLYTCDEYKEASELHFKKALDLLHFVEDEDMRHDLSLTIWRRAILRDSWKHTNLDSPLEIIEHKLVFRLVDLAIILDENVINLLPPMDALLDDDTMRNLQSDVNFQYLIKTGFEHVYRTQTVEM